MPMSTDNVLSTQGLPQRLAGYELNEKLGEGGMSVVYLAKQPSIERQVALKILPPGRAALPDTRRRFLREGQLAGQINHTNVVTYHELREVKGWLFMALEFVDGGDLSGLLRDRGGYLPERFALGLARDIGCGLEACHRAGVVHRDLKPHNIFLTRDKIPKIADFSASQPSAAALQAEDGDRQAGLIIGSPSYMAPEQAEAGKYVGASADIYALGATLYHLLTGQPPFRGANARETLKLLRTQPATDPRRFAKQKLKDSTCAILGKALTKKPEDRYHTARDMVEAIERALHEGGEIATPAGLPQQAQSRRATDIDAVGDIRWSEF